MLAVTWVCRPTVEVPLAQQPGFWWIGQGGILRQHARLCVHMDGFPDCRPPVLLPPTPSRTRLGVPCLAPVTRVRDGPQAGDVPAVISAGDAAWKAATLGLALASEHVDKPKLAVLLAGGGGLLPVAHAGDVFVVDDLEV